MRPGIAIGIVFVAAATLMVDPPPAAAQSTAFEQGRRCQTLLTCRYRRGGLFRGCISTFSCRSCRFTKRRCRTVNGRRVCTYPARCRWGA